MSISTDKTNKKLFKIRKIHKIPFNILTDNSKKRPHSDIRRLSSQNVIHNKIVPSVS